MRGLIDINRPIAKRPTSHPHYGISRRFDMSLSAELEKYFWGIMPGIFGKWAWALYQGGSAILSAASNPTPWSLVILIVLLPGMLPAIPEVPLEISAMEPNFLEPQPPRPQPVNTTKRPESIFIPLNKESNPVPNQGMQELKSPLPDGASIRQTVSLNRDEEASGLHDNDEPRIQLRNLGDAVRLSGKKPTPISTGTGGPSESNAGLLGGGGVGGLGGRPSSKYTGGDRNKPMFNIPYDSLTRSCDQADEYRDRISAQLVSSRALYCINPDTHVRYDKFVIHNNVLVSFRASASRGNCSLLDDLERCLRGLLY
jgi:hypothetical protein